MEFWGNNSSSTITSMYDVYSKCQHSGCPDNNIRVATMSVSFWK